MAVPKHLDEAVTRLKDASRRMKQVKTKSASLEHQQAWLSALTDFALALSDIHEYNNESIHEKLHEIAARTGSSNFSSGIPKGKTGLQQESL